jgi:uncharacterized delta-60 repeat protein
MKNSFLIISLLTLNSLAIAQSQFLDPSFNGSGYTITELTPYNDKTCEVIVQPDGKILTSGAFRFYNTATGNDSVTSFITRHNTDGSIDLSFNSTGIVYSDLQFSVDLASANMELLEDGEIVIAGTKHLPGTDHICVQKYNADGSKDSTFGNNGEKLVISPDGNYSGSNCLKIQQDGKIVIAGVSYGLLILARLESTGEFDISFGDNGIAAYYEGYPYIFNINFLSDNSIIVTGDSDLYQISIMKFNADGSKNTAFGTNGKKLLKYNFQFENHAYGLAIQPDDKILVSGHSNGLWLLYRINPLDGSLDNTFGSSGAVVNHFSGGTWDVATSVIAMPDNRIIATGRYKKDSYNEKYNIVIIRYLPDGNMDSTFGINGMIEFDFGNRDDQGKSSYIQPDGKIVCVGHTGNTEYTGNDMVILRCSEFSNVNTPEPELKSTFTVFPNPAGKLVNINVTTPCNGIYSLGILSLEGKTIQSYQKKLNAGANQLELSLNNLPCGTYMLVIKGDDFLASQKLLVE